MHDDPAFTLYNQILALHEKSYSPEDIAQTLGLSTYQVEIVLQREPTAK